jgi:hypothetical protein
MEILMKIRDTVNPVGNVVEDPAVEKFVESMIRVWDNTKPQIKWWQVWKRIRIRVVANFLIHCLDDLISYFIQYSIPGADKKATVLAVIGKIYDHIIKEAMPFCLRIFAGTVRNYVINELVSAAIDWIVEKYKSGNWRPKPVEEVMAQWTTLHAQLFGVPGGHRPT